MPRYDFRALDGAGALRSGSLDATDPNEIVRTLTAQGLRVQYVGPAKLAAPAVTQAVSYDRVCKVAIATDKDVYFLFSQLSNLFRAGLTPAKAFEDLAARQHRRGWTTALRHVAQMVSQGTASSKAMEVYHPIFSPGACGAVASGEAGGYLWEACEQVAQEAHRALKLRRLYGWVSFVFWSNLITFPLVWVGVAGMDRSIATINTEQGQTSQGVLQAMAQGFARALFGPYGALMLTLLAVYLVGRYLALQWYTRPLRHRLAASVPLIAQRTKGEVGAAFAFHLEHLQRAGISPHRSWTLASAAVPNEATSRQLQAEVPAMTESTRLSQAFHRSNLYPVELAHVLETGEMTGQVGRALEDARQLSQSKQQAYQGMLVAKGWVWIGLILIGAAALGFGFFYSGFLNSAYKHILEEDKGGVTRDAGVPIQGD